ncbi:trichothecene 3-O-acetyltransferase [Aspergillus vadensis CBS 113365]|uniref:Trichothecene 3-O-acetyltransferase n=1 Tax=Aspergillus vadensis (strain CBS 113365 / IMI 142717 / IBT 24658) TaxID=1448311 RepID=A0A319AZ63_ASPVC|nr:trichothecene 3-O-acetyltransferase [Aspergillus vadensis CBS 113365]PYH65105.1 trichothecene 3-O-acetyltransferase [Aspergillus vadensis CBS 113365]
MDDYLDIFGQQTFTINVQSCFCFPLPDNSTCPQIIDTLNQGLQRLHTSFPWLAGQVVNEGSGHGDTGSFMIRPLENEGQLVVRDLQHDPSIATMNNLQRAKFPISMLDQNIPAPRNIFPDSQNESAPVFLIQADFITGGLLLTFVAQHNAMDATGLINIIHLSFKACRNENFTDKELRDGNLPRRDIVPLLEDSHTIGTELNCYMVKPASYRHPSDSPEALRPKCPWTSYKISRRSLEALKSIAMASLPPPSFVSTDDAVTAFIWQSVTRARLRRLDLSAHSTLMRAVDVRGFPMRRLVEEPLGNIAQQLWLALSDKSHLEHHTSAIATFLSRTADKSKFTYGASIDTTTDLLFSSWATLESSCFDFNLGLELPEAVRKPRCNEVGGLTFLLPKTREGDFVVEICLRDEDIEELRSDVVFMEHAEYIG